VPAYLIPYGIATLAYGLLADRFGIHRVMFVSLTAFSALTMLTATAQSIEQLALWRVATGLGARGVVPLALALVAGCIPMNSVDDRSAGCSARWRAEWPSVRRRARSSCR
jgi:MFS family permease